MFTHEAKGNHAAVRSSKNQHSSEKARTRDEGQSSAPPAWHQQVRVVLVQTVKDSLTDNIFQWAAAVAYYAMLSLFPLLLAAVAIAAYFVDPTWATERVTSVLGEFVPRGEGTVRRVVDSTFEARGTIGIVSIAFLLWTGSRVFSVLIRALNVAYDVDETYSFAQRLGVELAFLLSAGVLFLLALSSELLLGLLWNVLQFLPAQRGLVFEIVKGAFSVLLLLAAFFLIYRFVPRGRQYWRSALIGAAAATALFLLARPLFLYYVQQFTSYNLVYGSLAVVITLLVWVWLVAAITLLGGELASHVHMIVFEGHSAEEVGKRHEERSPTRKRRSDESEDR